MDEQESASPAPKISLPPHPSETKSHIIIALLVYSALSGPIMVFLPEQSTPLDSILAVPFLILGVAWCLFDAKERDHRIGCLMKLLLIFVFVVGFPVYLISTRGLAFTNTLGFAFGLFIAMFACMVATGFVTLFICDMFFPELFVG